MTWGWKRKLAIVFGFGAIPGSLILKLSGAIGHFNSFLIAVTFVLFSFGLFLIDIMETI